MKLEFENRPLGCLINKYCIRVPLIPLDEFLEVALEKNVSTTATRAFSVDTRRLRQFCPDNKGKLISECFVTNPPLLLSLEGKSRYVVI